MIRRSLRLPLVIAAGWTCYVLVSYYAGSSRRHHLESAWFILTALALLSAALNPRPGQQPASPATGPQYRYVGLLLALLSAYVLYWPAIDIGLLSDDYVLLARPVSVALNAFAWEHYRPLPLLIGHGIHRVGGAAALHAVNVVLHGANAWLLWRLSIRLGYSERVSTFVAAVFLFFPAAVEPIAWNSGVFDVFTVFFGLLYLHGTIARTTRAQALGFAALAAALLSKETAIILPAIAAAVALKTHVSRTHLAGSIALASAYAIARLLTGTARVSAVFPAGQPSRYALKEMLVRPFATLGVPWTGRELELSYEVTALAVVAVILLVALIVVYAMSPRDGLRALVGPVWVLLGIAPLAGFFFVSAELQGSRYLYLPLCGWSLFLGDLVSGIETRRFGAKLLGGLLAATVAAGVWGVRRHLEPWQVAATRRDALLAEARFALLKTRCATAEFRGVPEDYESAQLFRNGFPEAVRDFEYRWEGATCRFVWDGKSFVRRE